MAGLSNSSNILGITPKIQNREDFFSEQVIKDFNTYSTWDETSLPDISEFQFKVEGDKVVEVPNQPTGYGIKSIFNKYTLVPVLNIDTRVKFNSPLVDSSSTRRLIKERSNPSIKNLVEASRNGLLGRETYSYSDFMYCKHLGKMPNNYLITLRRFPIACNDYIGQVVNNGKRGDEREIATSLGCLVTWLGTPGNDIENILSYTVKMPFQDKTAKMETVTTNDNSTPLGNIFSAFDSKYQQQVQAGQASNAIEPFFSSIGVKMGQAPYPDQLTFTDSNKVYGPVDVIKQTSMRSDEGLQFTHTFNLKFEYELRSYSNVNTRQAMLDLLANILTVTYVNGSFWRGGYRGLGPHQSDLFSNLRVMKAKGGFTSYVDAIAQDFDTVTKSAGASIKKQGGWWETIKNLANNFGGMLLGGMLNKMGRPQKAMVNSLLSPAPVGLWHVTVGNPFHPIMSIGNLILDETKIHHEGPLGLDDFPTKLVVECTLKRAKGRDSNEIERLYNQGVARIYSGLDKHTIDLINSAPDYGSGSGKNKTSLTINSSIKDFLENPDKLGTIKKSYASAQQTFNEESNKAVTDLNSKYDTMSRYWHTHDEDAIKLAGSEWLRGGGSKNKSSGTGKGKNKSS